jgi:hypothetical protein
MAHAVHLPHMSPSVVALGVAACLAGAGTAVAIEEIAETDAPAPQPTLQPSSTPVQAPTLGPDSGCYPKWGC